jgi:muramidase (phage lysozyme)
VTTAAEIRRALNDKNVQAFCHVIYKGETSDEVRGYARLNVPINGSYYIDAPPWVHPWHGRTTTEVGHSTACGRAQFLGTTWSDLARDYPADCFDFSPPCQDFGTVARIAYRGALDAVIAGRFDEAVRLCRKEWTSLPGAAENNPRWNLDAALAYYRQFGGTLATQPAAPIEEAGVPLPEEEKVMPEILGAAATVAAAANPPIGLLIGLANSLIDAFTPLAREKVQKELARHTDDSDVRRQVADSVIDFAKQLTGKADPIQATVAAVASPAAMEKLETTTLAELDRLSPFLDKMAQYQKEEWTATEDSMDRAAARGKAAGWDMAPPLVWWAIGAASVILLGLFMLAGVYAWKGLPMPEMLLTLIVQVVTGILGFVALLFAFRFGTSRSSAAKDEMVAQIVTRRPKGG